MSLNHKLFLNHNGTAAQSGTALCSSVSWSVSVVQEFRNSKFFPFLVAKKAASFTLQAASLVRLADWRYFIY
jgi:hypothetical protein